MTGQPVEWFAQQWGPFDPDLRGIGDDGRPKPLLLVDGEQVERFVEGDVPSPPTLNGMAIEGIRSTSVIKCREGAGFFGEAGNRGVLVIFTKRYRGPRLVQESMIRDDAPPCVPEPQFAPIEYFAQLGPFDPDLNARRSSDPGPLILLDGRQVEVAAEGQMEDLESLVVAQMAGRLVADPESAQSGPAPPNFSREADFRHIKVLKCDVSHLGYGPAARRGLILTFSQAWEGPLPELTRTTGEVCRAGDG
jgi:hypothetical protein